MPVFPAIRPGLKGIEIIGRYRIVAHCSRSSQVRSQTIGRDMETLLLSKADIVGLIDQADVIDAVEDAYRAYSAGKVDQPDYISFHGRAGGEIDFKIGQHKISSIISAKASSGGYKDNPALFGVPNGMGTILLFDARHGGLLCVMDGSLLTGVRTGASGAVSVKALARPDARVLAAIGLGNQARMQIRAIRCILDIQAIHAWHPDSEKAQRYKADIEGEFGIPVIVAPSAASAVGHADILITTTRGKGAVVEAEWVRPGTHVIAIGADQAGKQELDPALFARAKVIVDSLPQCLVKGETANALAANVIGREDIHGEIGEVLLGTKVGRSTPDEITIFDSTGMAMQDNTTAHAIYRKAMAAGVGSKFAFFES